MRATLVHNIDASELADINGVVTMPSADEKAVSNILDVDGKPAVKVWVETESRYLDASGASVTQIRNGASTDFLSRYNKSGGQFAQVSAFGGDYLSCLNGRGRFSFDFNSSEYSVFAVAKPIASPSGATTQALLGVNSTIASNYAPTLAFNVSSGGALVFNGGNVTTRLAGSATNHFNKVTLLATTFSQEMGVSLHEDGVETARNASDTNVQGISTLSFLGHVSPSGGFAGDAYELIILNIDVTKRKNKAALTALNTYLKTKYGIT
ncbi:hypothetical protein [Acinetobacter sp.]|uniref:hypothetical protein n=1 Tax=Acinetobacter sp. TaxID=472 RepID=UPI0028A75D79|nr:hypothetical protein [Acinetobacter sp.]